MNRTEVKTIPEKDRPVVATIAFTESGKAVEEKVTRAFQEECRFFPYRKDGKPAAFIERAFAEADVILFIGATGIAVRLIAPYLRSKAEDPAVLVMDDAGRHVISLLSGHIGGANRWAQSVGEAVGAEPIITTATDIHGTFSVDSWATSQGLCIGELGQIKYVAATLLRRESVGLIVEGGVKGSLPPGFHLLPARSATGGPENSDAFCQSEANSPGGQGLGTGVWISPRGGEKPFVRTLHLIPPCVVIGVGCRKNTSGKTLEEAFARAFQQAGLDPRAVGLLTSVDLKKEEPCLLTWASRHKVPFVSYTAEELMRVEGSFHTSAFVQKITGADNICERAATLGGGSGKLILEKMSHQGVTVALFQKDWSVDFGNQG